MISLKSKKHVKVLLTEHWDLVIILSWKEGLIGWFESGGKGLNIRITVAEPFRLPASHYTNYRE
jgi:hypothetical protein